MFRYTRNAFKKFQFNLICVQSIFDFCCQVTSYVLVFFLLTFAKVSIASVFRQTGGRGLLWCGAVTQLGSALGAAAMFVVVNVYQMFVQKYPCT